MKKRFDIDITRKIKKTAIIGHSGSGKSTLAVFLGKCFSLPVLHIDRIHFKSEWQERVLDEELPLMRSFLDANDDGWVIDGNYTKLEFDRRMLEADLIVYMNFNRFSCFVRAYRRSIEYRNRTRPSIADGCNEKFDGDFKRWILIEGRKRKRLERYSEIRKKHERKFVEIRNQKQLDAFMKIFETREY